jgi:hypothetical protein
MAAYIPIAAAFRRFAHVQLQDLLDAAPLARPGARTHLRCAPAVHWDQSFGWERAHSKDDELWWRDSARNRGLIEEAQAAQNADPEAAFRMLLEAAEAGSARALESVGWHYASGTAVAADFDEAAGYYRRAIRAGSWMATIAYARLLAAHGHVDESEEVLRDGVARDFVPAYFWLAWLRYDRAPTRATCRAIRPMLAYARNRVIPARSRFSGG